MADERERNIPFNGQLITSHHSSLLKDGDFSILKNFCYTPASIKTIKGMEAVVPISLDGNYTIVSSGIFKTSRKKYFLFQIYALKTNVDIVSSICIVENSLHSVSDIRSTQAKIIARQWRASTSYSKGTVCVVGSTYGNMKDCYLECIQSGTSGSSAPNPDNYKFNDKIIDGSVVWIKRKGNLVGTFSEAPDNTIIYANGYHVLIFGGDEHRLGKVYNVCNVTTLSANMVVNGTFESSANWTWGLYSGWWSYDSTNKEADFNDSLGGGHDYLQQNITLSAGRLYKLEFTVKNCSNCSLTPYVGGAAGTTVNSNGTYVQHIAAGSSNVLSFKAQSGSGGGSLSVDNVSLYEYVDYPDIDITDKVTSEQASESFRAVLVKDVSGEIYLDIGSPMILRAANFRFYNPNTSYDAQVNVGRYNELGLDPAIVTYDGTNDFQQDGKVVFAFLDDNAEDGIYSDKITYRHDLFLYWYRISLVQRYGIRPLPDDICVYLITGDTVVQDLPNIWDGTTYQAAGFILEKAGSYIDNTIPVSKRENSFTWLVTASSTSLAPTVGTASFLGGITTFYIQSIMPITGFKIYFPYSPENYSTVSWVNTNAATLNVYYWNGKDWSAVPNLVDGTVNRTGSIPFNQNGVVTWTSVGEGEEEKRTLLTNVPLYTYKIEASAAFSNTTYVDAVELIPVTRKLRNYAVCARWNNRAVLANTIGTPNHILCSAPNIPYTWVGNQIINLYPGSNREITALTTLFTRYAQEVEESLVIFKENEMYIAVGSDVNNIKIYPVSLNQGTKWPKSIQRCDLGIRISEGINKSVIIFSNENGVYLFDNSTIISISDAIIRDIVGASYMASAYDTVNSLYHVLLLKGGEYKEYVFDLLFKKWFEIERAGYPLLCSFSDDGTVYGITEKYITQLNVGYKMIDENYQAEFKMSMKPLLDSLSLYCDIRRLRLIAAPSSSTITCTLDSELGSTSIPQMDMVTPGDIFFSDPINLNFKGTVFSVSGVVNVVDEVELININMLYLPFRISR